MKLPYKRARQQASSVSVPAQTIPRISVTRPIAAFHAGVTRLHCCRRQRHSSDFQRLGLRIPALSCEDPEQSQRISEPPELGARPHPVSHGALTSESDTPPLSYSLLFAMTLTGLLRRGSGVFFGKRRRGIRRPKQVRNETEKGIADKIRKRLPNCSR